MRIESIFSLRDSFGFLQLAGGLYRNESVEMTNRYPLYLNVLYHIFGENYVIIQLLNVALSVMTLITVCAVMRYLEVDKKLLLIALLILSFAPMFVVYNIAVLRESIYSFLLTYSVAYYVKWMYGERMPDFVMACLWGAMAALLHEGLILVTLAYIVFFYVDKRNRKKVVVLTKMLMVIGAFALIPIALQIGNIGYLRFNEFGNFFKTVALVLERHNADAGNSFYLGTLEYDGSFRQFLLYSPIRIMYYFLSPVPWELHRAKDAVAFVGDSLIHLVFFYQVIKLLLLHKPIMFGKAQAFKKYDRIIIALALIIFAVAMIYAWGTTTAGTAIRHRDTFLSIEVLLIGMIIHRFRTVRL